MSVRTSAGFGNGFWSGYRRPAGRRPFAAAAAAATVTVLVVLGAVVASAGTASAQTDTTTTASTRPTTTTSTSTTSTTRPTTTTRPITTTGPTTTTSTTITPLKGTASPGYTVKLFVTNLFGSSVGPIGVVFGPDGSVYVADQSEGYVYKFGPKGGIADSSHRLGAKHSGPTGLAFSADGKHLFMAESGDVLEISPVDGSVVRTVAKGLTCPEALATDPLSGDLFFSQVCTRDAVKRIRQPLGAATVELYAHTTADVDGMTFAPDGTLFIETAGGISRVDGTNSKTAGTVHDVIKLPTADGVGVGAGRKNGLPPFILVNQNNGTVTKVDLRTTPPTATPIFTGGTRGDFVSVGLDGCLYATQSTSILKFTNADGTCDLSPIGAVRHLHERTSFTSSLVSIVDISKRVKDLGRSALLGLLLLVLVAFPAQLFNSTLSENYDEVKGWFGPLSRGADSVGRRLGKVPTWLGFGVFAVVAALLSCLLDPRFGFDGASLALLIGLVGSFVVVNAGFGIPELRYMARRHQDIGVLRVLPGTLLIGGICVLFSRIVGFQPGYLYGLLAGFVFVTQLNSDEDGRLSARAALAVLAVSLVSWIVWTPIKDLANHAHPNIVVLVLDALLAGVFIAGIESLAFGLIPLRFLKGERVYAWNRVAWAGVYALGIFVFVHVLLHPGVAYSESPDPHLWRSGLALFVLFGAGSTAFWLSFRMRRQAPPPPDGASTVDAPPDPVPLRDEDDAATAAGPPGPAASGEGGI